MGIALPIRIMWEHRRGKRGDLLGLPGTGEMTVRRERTVNRSGASVWESKQRTLDRVAKWVRITEADLVLDANGENTIHQRRSVSVSGSASA